MDEEDKERISDEQHNGCYTANLIKYSLIIGDRKSIDMAIPKRSRKSKVSRKPTRSR